MNIIFKYYEGLSNKSSCGHVIFLILSYFVKSLGTLHHKGCLKVPFYNNKGIIRTVLKIGSCRKVFVLKLRPSTSETGKGSGCGLPLMMSLVFKNRLYKCKVSSTLSILMIL